VCDHHSIVCRRRVPRDLYGQDAFAGHLWFILTVLILLEFNHSIFVALAQRTGAIQVRIVVLIAILAVVRKMMLLDLGSVTVQVLLALGTLLPCLGGLFGFWPTAIVAGTKPRQDITRGLAIVRSSSCSRCISAQAAVKEAPGFLSAGSPRSMFSHT